MRSLLGAQRLQIAVGIAIPKCRLTRQTLPSADKLVSTSAVVLDNSNQPLISLGASGGATNNWRREMIPCGNLDFNTIMSAIKSNRSSLFVFFLTWSGTCTPHEPIQFGAVCSPP